MHSWFVFGNRASIRLRRLTRGILYMDGRAFFVCISMGKRDAYTTAKKDMLVIGGELRVKDGMRGRV